MKRRLRLRRRLTWLERALSHQHVYEGRISVERDGVRLSLPVNTGRIARRKP